MSEAEFCSGGPVASLRGRSYSQSTPVCWYALKTRSRHEKVVRSQLTRRNIENFLPTVKRWSQWKDRRKEIEFPVFSGYCFARFSLDERVPVLQVKGVVSILSANGRPEPIPDSEIQSLMTLINNYSHYDLHPFPKQGMLVEVVEGPLKGVKGCLLFKSNPCRLVVSISLIREALAVEVKASSLVPLREVLA